MRWTLLPAAALLLALPAPLARAGERPGVEESTVALEPVPSDEISDARRAEIRALIAGNVGRLAAEDRLPAVSAAGVLLEWPLVPHLGRDDFGYYGISAFVDQDPNFPSLLRDYNCGSRTYDSASGYNHQGTDIFLYPLAWNRVDSDGVEVVAGADGVIVGKDDGNPDRSCAAGGGTWNAVYVRHADGSEVWYGHMKNGSLTAKGVGDAVAAGEHLGIVASSGSSTGPHLHLELYDSALRLVDPWQGACNRMNLDSWWAAQRPYHDPAVLKLMSGFAALVRGTCPEPDQSNEALVFRPGDTIWFTRFYRDLRSSDPSQCTIYRPDGSVFRTWTFTSSQPYFPAAYVASSFPIGAAESLGTWRFEVVFDSVTYDHAFYLVGAGPWLLRNARLSSIAPPSAPLSSLFVGSGTPTLDFAGLDTVPSPGEGDDDDAYIAAFGSGQEDPDAAVLGDDTRPLVFYQLDVATATLRVAKSASGGIALSY